MTRSVRGPTRDGARARPSPDRSRLQAMAALLTERDHRVCADLYEHRAPLELFEVQFPRLRSSRDACSNL